MCFMKQKFREWLTEHFGFVPVEDYELRGQVLSDTAKSLLECVREIKRQKLIIANIVTGEL